MVDESASITTSVSQGVTVQQSVTEGVSAKTSVSRNVSIGEVIDAVASPYADIVATSPTLFVPLKYASTDADGQILYQDSAATTPVTTAGDPVGAVVWDGVTVADQPTDANRPTWQGESTGVTFDRGSSQFLFCDEANSLSSANGFTFIAKAVGAGDGFQQTLFRGRPLGAFGAASGIAFTWQAGGVWSSGASPYEDTGGNSYTLDDAGDIDSVGALTHTFVIDNSSAISRRDGVEISTSITVQSGSTPLGTISISDAGIGASDVNNIPQRFFDGDMLAIAIYDSALASGDYTTAETAVDAL